MTDRGIIDPGMSQAGGWGGGGGGGGRRALIAQFLVKPLTLSQPGGNHSTAVLRAPLPPGFSDLATALIRLLFYKSAIEETNKTEKGLSLIGCV